MNRLSLLVLLTLCAGSPVLAGPIAFADDFEKASLDSYWSVFNSSGNVSLTKSIAQSGLQSVQFATTQIPGVGKNVGLYHTFDAPVYGDVSIWVYDNAAGVGSSNYFSLYLSNSLTSKSAGVLTFDYDLGPGTGSNYNIQIPSTAVIETGIVRSRGWHQFAINTTQSGQTYRIDGQAVYSISEGFAFDQFRFGLFGPDSRPAWTTSFDNFSFSPLSTVPAPGSLTLFAIASVGLFVTRRRLCKSTVRNENS